MFSWLVTGPAISSNPATDVRGPRYSANEGKTPVLFEDDARLMLGAIDTRTLIGKRDRAMIAVMLYSFARVTALVSLRVRDFAELGNQAYFVLREKGGKHRRIPAHHKAAKHVRTYLETAGISDQQDAPLFRAALDRSSRRLTTDAMSRRGCLDMIKRRARAAGLPEDSNNHTFRGTGITNFLANGGNLESAARIAGHDSTRTTRVYDRNPDKIQRADIERFRIEKE